jgi:hypothetical protein
MLSEAEYLSFGARQRFKSKSEILRFAQNDSTILKARS